MMYGMFASANATSIGSEAAFVRMRMAMSRCANPLATRSAMRAATARRLLDVIGALHDLGSHAGGALGAQPDGSPRARPAAAPAPSGLVPAPPIHAPLSPDPGRPQARSRDAARPTSPPTPPRAPTAALRMTELATATISGVHR